MKDIFATKEGKQDFSIAVIIIVIFAVVIYQFLSPSSDEVPVQDNVKDDYHVTEVETANKKPNELQYSYTSSSENKATTIQVVDAYESEQKSAIVVSDILKSTPSIADKNSEPTTSAKETILLYETEEEEKEEEENQKPPETEKIVPETTITETSKQVETKVKEVVTKTSTPKISKKIKNTVIVPDNNLNCVIIVGVFKEDSNKAKVIAQLQSLGYKHSEGILRDSIKFVGVPVDCDNKQMRQKLLKELNKAFGIEAWVKKL